MSTWLAQQSRQRGEATSLIQGDQRVSYADLAEHAARRAAVLAQVGVRPGDRVFIQAHTDLPSAIWLHAVLWLGAVLVPLDPKLPHGRTRKLIDRLRPAAVITAAPDANRPDGAVESPPFIDATALPDPNLAPVDPAPYVPVRHATIMLTSGSTAEPKAVPLTLENHRASTLAIAQRIGMSALDQWLLCLPLNHIGGLAILMRSVITGSSVCLQPGFDPAMILRELAERPHTLTSMVPGMLQRLLERQTGRVPTKLRALLVGGAPAQPSLLRRARTLGWPVLPTWGMTEACSQLATLSPREAEQVDFETHAGIAGRPLAGVEVRIGRSGALQVRGPMVFSGYLDDRNTGPDGQGWFLTGDAGEFMSDGRLCITGRTDEVIISGGVNVNLESLRQRLTECSLVRDIVLIPLDDPRWGQRIAAVVQPRDAHVDPDTLVSSLVDWSRQRLMPAERPLKWRIVESIPVTAAGKPAKAACAALF